ncbi:hypothetical protein TELCIR_25421 [Teladorsagia circumcincta]|uniref:Uncharacterized protein n=1 Tax=Teladorsagia circumcincta TaxID=45464 RepID=A0A2G9T5M4_TELCI|nr:hypothetical protein TELCIR_25421 [Teladorsagia circumcincta]
MHTNAESLITTIWSRKNRRTLVANSVSSSPLLMPTVMS